MGMLSVSGGLTLTMSRTFRSHGPGRALVVSRGEGSRAGGHREAESEEHGESERGPFHDVCLLRWFPSREKAGSDIGPRKRFLLSLATGCSWKANDRGFRG
jgi:hypothetical protein